MSNQRTFIDRFRFQGAFAPPVVGSKTANPWCSITVETAGAPSVESDGKNLVLTLENDNEAEEATAYFGDLLAYDITKLDYIDLLVAVPASVGSGISAVFGVASARAAYDSVAASAWFKLAGSNAVVVETDDGATNTDDIAANGYELGTTLKQCRVDFTNGLADVRFAMDNGDGRLRRVAKGTTFTMAGYSGLLQPYLSTLKASGTDTMAASIAEVVVAGRY